MLEINDQSIKGDFNGTGLPLSKYCTGTQWIVNCLLLPTQPLDVFCKTKQNPDPCDTYIFEE